jgi:hypothetical protein
MLDYSTAPNQDMVPGIKRYVEKGLDPGHFLTALFSDELTNTFAHADETNTPLIREWVLWVYDEMPGDTVGSRATVQSYASRKQKERQQKAKGWRYD